jgi:hypothetical protein
MATRFKLDDEPIRRRRARLAIGGERIQCFGRVDPASRWLGGIK